MQNNEPDMSELLQKFASMMQGKDMPQELQHMMENFSSSNTSSDSSSKDSHTDNFDDFSFPDLDLNMFLKLKTVMDSMKSNKDDPRSNLLLSLKPYLKSSRREKVDQYIKFFNMAKAFEAFNIWGGDTKNGNK